MSNYKKSAPREWHWECCQCRMRNNNHLLEENGQCENCGHESTDCISCLDSMDRESDRPRCSVRGRGWYWASQEEDETTESEPIATTEVAAEDPRRSPSTTSAASESAPSDVTLGCPDEDGEDQQDFFDVAFAANDEEEYYKHGKERSKEEVEAAARQLRHFMTHTVPVVILGGLSALVLYSVYRRAMIYALRK